MRALYNQTGIPWLGGTVIVVECITITIFIVPYNPQTAVESHESLALNLSSELAERVCH